VLNAQRIGESAADYDLVTCSDRAIWARSGVWTEGLRRARAIQQERRIDALRVADQAEKGIGRPVSLQVKQLLRWGDSANPVQSGPDHEEFALCLRDDGGDSAVGCRD